MLSIRDTYKNLHPGLFSGFSVSPFFSQALNAREFRDIPIFDVPKATGSMILTPVANSPA